MFNKKLVELIFKIAFGIYLILIVIIVFAKIVVNKKDIVALASTAIIFWLIRFVFKKSRLITQVRTDGIYVRFAPLRNSFIIYKWIDIDKIFIRTYNPITEYGGWGIRF